jgi:hypothetical protein
VYHEAYQKAYRVAYQAAHQAAYWAAAHQEAYHAAHQAAYHAAHLAADWAAYWHAQHKFNFWPALRARIGMDLDEPSLHPFYEQILATRDTTPVEIFSDYLEERGSTILAERFSYLGEDDAN